MRRRSIQRTGFALLLAVAAGCNAAAQIPGPARERVLETFNVGAKALVRALVVDSAANTLWVGTSAGVHEVDLATGRLRNTFTREHGLASEHVYCVGIDAAGNKWFGTKAGGVSRYRDGKWRTYFPMHGLGDYWVRAFAAGADGDLWFGTGSGVSRYDPNTGKFRNYARELVSEWVSAIAVDGRGRIWAGTEGGVSMFDGRSWRSWTQADGLGAAAAADVVRSRTPHLTGAEAAGRNRTGGSHVFAILAAADGTIWAGTWGGGVARYDGERWLSLTTRDGLAGNVVYSIAQDAKGALWFGTDAGISRYDGVSWRNFGKREGLGGLHVYALAAAPGGDVWAGTRHGVTRIGTR